MAFAEELLLIAATLFLFAAVIALYANRYKRVPPDQAMVVYGARRGDVGFTVIGGGGGRFIRPIVESYKVMSLEARSLEIRSLAVKTKSGISLNLNSEAQIKISNEQSKLNLAAQHLLSKSANEIDAMVQEVLQGKISVACAGLEPEQVNADRAALGGKVREAASADLSQYGLDLVSFEVKDVDDDLGYISAIGKEAFNTHLTRAQIAAEVRMKMQGDPSRARRIAVFLERIASLDDAEFERVLKSVDDAAVNKGKARP